MRNKAGQSIIEILVAVAVAGLALPALLTGLIASREGKVQQRFRLEAVTLLKEAEEAVRIVREQGWNSFAVNGTYHPVINGNTYQFASSSETINGFTRSIVVSDVQRNTSGVIVSSGGTVDPSTKMVVVSVSWGSIIPTVVSSTEYVSRFFDSAVNEQTSLAQFDAGTKTRTATSNTLGGEIQIATNTKGKWCEPNLSLTSIDLPGAPNAVYATEGHVYAATGLTALATQDSFAHVLVSNTDPPTSTLHGKLQGYQTQAVFGDASYGYIATTNNTKEIVIINLNTFADAPNKIYAESGYFNTTTNSGSSSSTDAETIFVLNNRGYVTAGNYLYVFDLSSKSGSRPRIGNRIQFADSGDTAGEIYGRVIGGSTYIYLAVQGSTPEEIKIANVTNHNVSTQWRIVGSLNIEPNNCSTLESGKAIFVNPSGTRAYISSTNDLAFKEFFTIDTSNVASPSLVGGLATNPPCTNGGGYESSGMDPEQSVVVSLAENRAILVGVDSPLDLVDSQEYQVLDLTNESTPVKCGGLDQNLGIYGIAAVKETDGDAFAYIITGDILNELKIIQGGPDGTYLEDGVYESATFDASSSATFNRFEADISLPPQTTLQYQFAVADPVNDSCSGASFTYVGPDLTSSTYFATSSAIPLDNDDVGYENPGRCMRYKAYFTTTDYYVTPKLYDMKINYSP